MHRLKAYATWLSAKKRRGNQKRMLLKQAPGTIPTGVLREVGNEDIDERDHECTRPKHPAREEEPRFFAGVGSTNRPTGKQSSGVHQQYEPETEQPIELRVDLLNLKQVRRQREG